MCVDYNGHTDVCHLLLVGFSIFQHFISTYCDRNGTILQNDLFKTYQNIGSTFFYTCNKQTHIWLTHRFQKKRGPNLYMMGFKIQVMVTSYKKKKTLITDSLKWALWLPISASENDACLHLKSLYYEVGPSVDGEHITLDLMAQLGLQVAQFFLEDSQRRHDNVLRPKRATWFHVIKKPVVGKFDMS